MIRLVYASTLKKEIDASEVDKIHRLAHDKNSKLFLSGILVFGDGIFIQCLEGDRHDVSELFCKICKDPRHEQIVVFDVSEISERSFEKWSMKLIMLTEEKRKIILRYSESEALNPYTMSADGVIKFLSELNAKNS